MKTDPAHIPYISLYIPIYIPYIPYGQPRCGVYIPPPTPGILAGAAPLLQQHPRCPTRVFCYIPGAI